MKFLLDQGLPRSAVHELAQRRHEAVHTADRGLGEASDEELIAYAVRHELVVVTLDADFHAIIAVAGSDRPSVIRVRVEGLTAGPLAALIDRIASVGREDLESGALVSADPGQIRIRRLPIHPAR